MEWKSGDVMFAGMRPQYSVLKKVPAGSLESQIPGKQRRLMPLPAMGQPPLLVTGQVADAVSGAPIFNARVDDNSYAAGPNKAPQQAWTDTNGNYELPTWPEEHTIAASAPGYETKLVTLLTSFWGTERQTRMDFRLRPRNNGVAKASRESSPGFGPARETILKARPLATAELLDLDTGATATSTNFGANDRETHAWIRENKLDVLGVIEKGMIAVLGMDMVAVPAVSNGWETITAQNVTTNWGLSQSEPNKIVVISPATDQTDTWRFRTREGGHGVLQILGPSDAPPGVKIRYKLVE
jgi:hypothetical protein